MAINAITTDYSGRTRDIFIFRGIDPLKTGKSPISLKFGKISSYCAGVEKLVQRYAIHFLSNIGSQPNFPTFGTNFLQKVSTTSRKMTKEDVTHIFNFANAEIMTLFKGYQAENPNIPLDEQIARATLTNVYADSNVLNLDVKIVTLAGDTVNFLLPLPDTL